MANQKQINTTITCEKKVVETNKKLFLIIDELERATGLTHDKFVEKFKTQKNNHEIASAIYSLFRLIEDVQDYLVK